MYFIPGVRFEPFHAFYEASDGYGNGVMNNRGGGWGAGFDNGDGDGIGAGYGDGEGEGEGEGLWFLTIEETLFTG